MVDKVFESLIIFIVIYSYCNFKFTFRKNKLYDGKQKVEIKVK
jgi:hypothetical protein